MCRLDVLTFGQSCCYCDPPSQAKLKQRVQARDHARERLEARRETVALALTKAEEAAMARQEAQEATLRAIRMALRDVCIPTEKCPAMPSAP